MSFFSHDRPDGTLYLTVYDLLEINYLGGGENIVAGYRSPEAVMEGWINFLGHRGNILDGDYLYVGFARYIGVDGRIYWTQNFMM